MLGEHPPPHLPVEDWHNFRPEHCVTCVTWPVESQYASCVPAELQNQVLVGLHCVPQSVLAELHVPLEHVLIAVSEIVIPPAPQ
jgi:hypothetical protein